MPRLVDTEDGFVRVPASWKKTFRPNVEITDEQFFLCVDFAREMAYGQKHQTLAFWSNDYHRGVREIFKNALQGKLAEVGFYNFYTKKGREIPLPDFWVWNRWVWEDCDMEINWKKISIKSTKHFWNLLLLEKNRYSEDGLYLEPTDGHPPIKYDLIYLVRIEGVDSPNPEDYSDHTKIRIEITWYLTYEAFLQVIQDRQYITKWAILWNIPLIVDNYYVCSTDLQSV